MLLILFLFGSVFLAAFAVYQRSARQSPVQTAQPAPIVAEPARPIPTAVAAPRADPTDTIQEIELKVAKQQLEKTLTDLAETEKELATSEALMSVSDEHPIKKAQLQRVLFLKERSAVLQKKIQLGSPNPAAGVAAVRQIELRVIRDQFEKTLTALTDAERELAISPAMGSLGDDHPTKKALLNKILFLNERRAVLRKEIQELNAQAKPVAVVATNGLPQMLPAGKTSSAAQKWHFAWIALTEKRRELEVGRIPPEGVFAADRDLAVAEGEFLGKPVIGAAANVAYARSMLNLVRRKQAAGMAIPRDVNDATLSLTQAEEALNRISASGATPRQ